MMSEIISAPALPNISEATAPRPDHGGRYYPEA
jgi:hypothetical protein